MRQFVERKIERERDDAARVAKIKHSLWEHQICVGHAKSAKRVEQMRVHRVDGEIELERSLEQERMEAEQHRAQQEQISIMEEAVAKELAGRHAAEIRADVNRRRVCENSEEIKALKLKLQAASMNKDRKIQLGEKIERAVEEKHFEKDISVVMEERRQDGLRAEERVEASKLDKRLQAKEMNLSQIDAHRRYMEEEGYRMFMKDKAQVQEVVDKVAREDAEAAEKDARSKEETRTLLNKFRMEQDERRRKQLALEAEEQRKIEEFAENKRKMEEELALEKERIEELKKKRLTAMVGRQAAKDKEKEEMEYYRNELHHEELEALSRRREEMELRKKLEDRVEMHRAYEMQMKLKEEKRVAELEKEEEFRHALLIKFASDDRIEQLNAQKRRMKVEEHKREVSRLWKEKERVIAEERAKDNEALDWAREDERKRQVFIEEERQRLLREHATSLKEHLPKNVFDTDDDHVLVMGREPRRD